MITLSKKDKKFLNEKRSQRFFSNGNRATKILKMNNCNFIFLSPPNSGRTWIRYFLARYIENHFNTDFCLAPGPEEWHHNKTDFPSVHFSHNYYDYFQRSEHEPFLIDLDLVSKKSLIVLIRNPIDTVISYYYDQVYRERKLSNIDINQFMLTDRYNVENQSKFILQLLEYYEQHENPKLLLNYEKLISNRKDEFKKITNFIFDEFNQKAFKFAFDRSEFNKMQKYEKFTSIKNHKKMPSWLRSPRWRITGRDETLKIRSGKSNDYFNTLEEKTIKEIRNLKYTSILLERLNNG